MSDPKWPSYEVGPEAHLHALGVIAATFNRLEHRLLGIFLLYVGYDDATAWLFRRLNDNRARMDLILKHLPQKAENQAIKEAVEHFCICSDSCAQNRNILMHSRAVLVTQGDEFIALQFVKLSKEQFIWNRYLTSLTKLRQVADEANLIAEYGEKIHDHVMAFHRAHEMAGPVPLPKGEPLPSKPPVPVVLTKL